VRKFCEIIANYCVKNDIIQSDDMNVSSPLNNNSNYSNRAMPQEPLDPAEEEKRQAELMDIQKELEAKFDELFGSIDSDN